MTQQSVSLDIVMQKHFTQNVINLFWLPLAVTSQDILDS